MGHRPQGARSIHQGGGHMDGDLDRFGTHLARVHRLGARRKHRRIGIDSTKEGKFDFLKGKDVIPRQIVLEEIKNSQGKLFSFGSFFISCQSIFYLVLSKIFIARLETDIS